MNMRILLLFLVLLIGCKKTENTVDPPTPPPPPPPPVTPVDPNALSIPVTAAQMQGCFTVTAKKNIHPRLLISAAEIDALKAGVQADPFAKPTYDDIITRANNILGTALLEYKLDGANLTDAADADAGSAGASGIAVTIPAVSGGTTKVVTFGVTIN